MGPASKHVQYGSAPGEQNSWTASVEGLGWSRPPAFPVPTALETVIVTREVPRLTLATPNFSECDLSAGWNPLDAPVRFDASTEQALHSGGFLRQLPATKAMATDERYKG